MAQQKNWKQNDTNSSEFPINNRGGTLPVATRRRNAESNQFRDNYSYISATPFNPPPTQSTIGSSSYRQPLYAHTYGGYSPVKPDDSEVKKVSTDPRLFIIRLAGDCRDCLRFCGCSNHEMLATEGPDGDYYREDFNDQPDNFMIGTSEDNGIWMNQLDMAGTIMAFMVWFLLSYSAITVTFLAETGGIHCSFAMMYVFFCCMALASHAKTTFTDPGAVPSSAQPNEALRRQCPDSPLSMCSQCQSYKPPFSHHCRICNRCISRMDHHCPWMNNCVGAGNIKHFTLFLVYTWLCSTMSLVLLGWNYFFCVTEECTFTSVLVFLTRIMTLLSIGAFLFTSSMLMNVTYGIMTGIGTIDRLKKKATDTLNLSDEEPIPLKDIFGIAGYHTWLVPIDPVFDDYDRVMGYSTAQRLLREQMKVQLCIRPSGVTTTSATGTSHV